MTSSSILIADAGSTKTEWALVSDSGNSLSRFDSPGINAVITPKEEIELILHTVAESVSSPSDISRIFFYGAGCASPEICFNIKDAIRREWSEAEITVASDLVGAAVSLLGSTPGIACILGTGSNSAFFDGEKVTMNIPPLGFILGDEGSGTALGKRLIKEIYKSNIPSRLKNAFFEETNLTLQEIIKKVYREPSPNKFIASLVPFIRNHADHPFINNMVVEEFREFFRRNTALYPDASEYPVCFTGSVAYHFEHQLREAASGEEIRIGKITQKPMDGLIDYITGKL